MAELKIFQRAEDWAGTEKRKILRINKHIDGGWFWSKYSANPYRGCKFGCSYCFLRQEHYGLSGRMIEGENKNDPFSEIVTPIMNAPQLLDAELSALDPDVIIVGDYQPIEKNLQLSRQMLEVCKKHDFPVVVITRSPLIIRDIDVLKEINERSGATVVFSAGYHSEKYKEFFEPSSPSIESRFYAMRKISEEGIYAGTAAMPILPYITDDDKNFEGIVAKTKANGGSFVMVGGLALDNEQKKEFYRRLESLDPSLVEKYEKLYGNDFCPRDNSWASLGRKVRELCRRSGLEYRMKRPVVQSGFAANKKLAEKLFLLAYEMELDERSHKEIKRVRELAFFIDELYLEMFLLDK